MNKKVLTLLLTTMFTLPAVQAKSNFQTLDQDPALRTAGLCPQHYPLGAPIVALGDKARIERRTFYLCEDNYAVQFDPATKTPLWVSERIVHQKQTKEERTENFSPHPKVPYAAQARLSDYKGSKFDRGHMAAAANMTSPQAMNQSFYLTNMVPQVGPNMNRGIWAEVEMAVRYWASKRGELLVVTGPIFNHANPQTIGNSQVWVPSHLYKIVLDPKTMQSISFVIPNQQIVTRKTKEIDEGNAQYPQTLAQNAVNCGQMCKIENFIVSISDVEKYTGLNFFAQLKSSNAALFEQKSPMWH